MNPRQRRRQVAKKQQTPPFEMGERVIVLDTADDAMFIGGARGIVIGVDLNTDPREPFGPWVVSVELDNGLKLAFDPAELRRETEPPAPHEDEHDRPVPFVPTTKAKLENLKTWIQRARELQYEGLGEDNPVYDDVRQEAMAADGLAAEVSAYLAQVVDGGAA